jgi:hypothetical protein
MPHIQGGSNMTGTCCGLFTHKSVPVIFESPCTYIKVLEGFSTCCHELLLLRVRHPLKNVRSCWQEFGGIQWKSHLNDIIVLRLNKEDLGRQPSPPLQRGRCLETREGYSVNSQCAKCKEFLQQRCVSHVNLIMGCVVGKSTVSEWGCSVTSSQYSQC